MGRVYNALVKAERFQDTDRPIGRPEPNGAEAGSKKSATPGFSRNPSSAAGPPFIFEDDFGKLENATTSTYAESSAAAESTDVLAAAGIVATLPRSGPL